jgi:dTDP-4-dehydrorhamnose reductase
MKVLIVGSTGLLGGKFLEAFSKRHHTIGTYYASDICTEIHRNLTYMDVTKSEMVEHNLLNLNPDIVIYAASMSSPDYCEENRTLAYKINVKGLETIAKSCAALRKKIIFLSTDHVFNGSDYEKYDESSNVDPANYYGLTKLKAEEIIKKVTLDYLIIRPSMVYGYSTHTQYRGFLNAVIEALKNNNEIHLDDSMIRYPILADDIVEAVVKLIDKGENGTFHVSTSEGYTKYEFGKLIARTFDLDSSLINPINEYPNGLKAPRPLSVLLNSSKIERLGINPIDVKEGLKITRRQAGCLFRMIYSVRPDLLIAGQNASEFRIKVGKQLAKEKKNKDKIDIVIPVPESGIYSATGYADESGKPFYFGLIRDYYTEKTLYSKSEQDRNRAIRKKLLGINSVLKGKNIALIDEAVLSGSTLKIAVEKVKKAGAASVHVRIPSPPIVNQCTGRVLPKINLIAKKNNKLNECCSKKSIENEMMRKLDVDSFTFLSIEKFIETTINKSQVCYDCFLDCKKSQ